MIYEALYYDGWDMPPAYYLVGEVEGDTPEQALAANLERITQQIREQLNLSDEVSDEDIQETIYVLRENGLLSVQDLERLGMR